MNYKQLLIVFEESFKSGFAGCRHTCDCGIEYFDDSDNRWDWDEEELKSLRSDPDTIGVQGAVEIIEFEGATYVLDCDCWRQRAERIIGFIMGHDYQIATMLNTVQAIAELEIRRRPKVRGIKPLNPLTH